MFTLIFGIALGAIVTTCVIGGDGNNDNDNN
jgi:hypothetical protein